MVTKFCYRLQVVLDRSQTDERTARTTFCDLERALAKERVALEKLAARVETMRKDFPRNGSALALSSIDVERQCDALGRALMKQRSCVASASDRTAASRAELAVLVRKRVALERHRARAYQAYEEMQSRRDAADFDESNSCVSNASRPVESSLCGPHLS